MNKENTGELANEEVAEETTEGEGNGIDHEDAHDKKENEA